MIFNLGMDGKYRKTFDAVLAVFLVVCVFTMPLFFLPFTADFLNFPKQLFLFLLIIVSVFLWLFKAVLMKQMEWKKTLLDWPLVGFAAVSVISTLFSLSRGLSMFGRPDEFVFHIILIFSLLLFFWLVIQVVDDQEFLRWLSRIYMMSGALAAVFFLSDGFGVEKISKIANTVSSTNSVFGIFLASVAIFSLGFLLYRKTRYFELIVPFFSAAVCFIGLARLGFLEAWVIFLVGVGLLLMIGVTMLRETRMIFLAFLAVLFFFGWLFVLVGTPQSLKKVLPMEFSLAVDPSWTISSQTVLENFKNFIIGSGPATFIYDFSLYRDPAFNSTQIGWSTRFHKPINSFFGILAETGLLGAILFCLIVLLSAGIFFSGWLKIRPSSWEKIKEKIVESEESANWERNRYEAFIPAVSWLAMTIGMAISFFDTVAWWNWFWLLAISMLSFSFVLPDIMKKRNFSLSFSPQYSLALAFAVVLVFTAIIVGGSFGIRFYVAEAKYYSASLTANQDEMLSKTNEAIKLRNGNPQYHLTAARIYIQQANDLASKPEKAQEALEKMSLAVNEAKIAADLQPKNVQTWDLLSVMYLNVRAAAPDANKWAEEALAKAVVLEPSNPIFHWRLANVLVFANRQTEAEDSLKKAIELKPDFVDAYRDLSALYENKKDFTRAIDTYRPLEFLIQKDPDLLFTLGRLYYNRDEKGDKEMAERSWLSAINLNENHSNSLYGLGVLYESTNRHQEALKYFKRVKDLNPDNPNIGDKIEQLLSPN